MNSSHLVALLRHFRSLAGGGEIADLSDRQLLGRYAGCRDEMAFAALLRRHGRMVWNVCRRVLTDAADADDAFQATFLVLIHKAAKLSSRGSLAAWLQGVAWRVARKAKAETARRRIKERRADREEKMDFMEEVEQRDLRALLDEELDHLPEKYRAPLVLCYLEGLSYRGAAQQLGWKEGTVCGRLARARELLRQRLSHRGLTLSGAALTAALTESVSAPAAAARLATLFALGQAAGSGAVTAPVAALAQGVLHAMTAAKLKTAAALLAVSCLLAGGGGLAAHRLLTAKKQTPQRIDAPAAKETDRTQRPQENRRDLQGDPLPTDAIARLGTTRFRHGDNIFELFFTPDGKRLVSADRDGARLWDAASGRQIRWLGRRFQTSLRSLSLPADGKTVVLAEHHSETIQILDSTDGKLLRQFKNGPDNDDRFCAAIYSPDGKLLASNASKTIRLWNSETGKLIRQWRVDTATIHRILFTPDGKTLISACDDGAIRFWDASTGKEVRRIADHPGPAIGLALSPDGKTLASQGSKKHESNLPNGGRGVWWQTDNKIHLWDAATGKKLRHLEAFGPSPIEQKLAGFHPNAIYHFCFSPDGKTLVTAGADLTVRFWDVKTSKELRRWENHWVDSLAFSPDGKVLATAVEGSIRLWDAATGRELREQPGHHGGVRSLVLSYDRRRIASAGTDRTVRIWDAATGRELHRLRSPEGHTVPIAFSADGRTLTTVGVALSWIGADQKGRVWDVASGKELRQLPELTECSAYAVSADGRTYAFAGKDKRIWLWDVVGERKLPVRIEHPKGIDNLSFSLDGRALFAWCGDGKVHVWSIATGKEQRQFAVGNNNDVIATAFSPDGRWFAWGGRDRWIHHYDLATGQEVRRFMAASPFVDHLTFSLDGRTLAAASMYDPVIYLWETASGQVRHRLSGHEGRIFAVVFSADGKRLLSGSDDSTALVWNLIGERGRVRAPSLQKGWDELASADAQTAYRAMRTLAGSADEVVDFLSKQLRPIPEPEPKRVAGLIADLDHDSFARREKATKELENLGEAIEPALLTAHDGAKSAEMRRRMEELLAKLADAERQTPSAARLQILRAIELLERIDTLEARQLLRELAGGAARARQTREAKTALQRLIDAE